MKKYYDMHGQEIKKYDVIRYTLTGYELVVMEDDKGLYISVWGEGITNSRLSLDDADLAHYEIIGLRRFAYAL